MADGYWNKAGKNCHIGLFGGECCNSEILKLKQQAQKEPPEVIIGVGGGKTADTAKVLRIELDLPVVIVLTIARSTICPLRSTPKWWRGQF